MILGTWNVKIKMTEKKSGCNFSSSSHRSYRVGVPTESKQESWCLYLGVPSFELQSLPPHRRWCVAKIEKDLKSIGVARGGAMGADDPGCRHLNFFPGWLPIASIYVFFWNWKQFSNSLPILPVKIQPLGSHQTIRCVEIMKMAKNV